MGNLVGHFVTYNFSMIMRYHALSIFKTKNFWKFENGEEVSHDK